MSERYISETRYFSVEIVESQLGWRCLCRDRGAILGCYLDHNPLIDPKAAVKQAEKWLDATMPGWRIFAKENGRRTYG